MEAENSQLLKHNKQILSKVEELKENVIKAEARVETVEASKKYLVTENRKLIKMKDSLYEDKQQFVKQIDGFKRTMTDLNFNMHSAGNFHSYEEDIFDKSKHSSNITK